MLIKPWFLLLFAIGAAAAVGCGSDDDDVPAGSAGRGASSGQGGSSGRGGMAGQGGASGRGGNGQGGASAEGGGAGAGEGGAGDVCPAFILSAEGKPCSPEGKICGDGADNPCEFGNFIRCTDGVWLHQEAFPDPNCGQGGAGQAGGAGAGATP